MDRQTDRAKTVSNRLWHRITKSYVVTRGYLQIYAILVTVFILAIRKPCVSMLANTLIVVAKLVLCNITVFHTFVDKITSVESSC